MKKPIQVALGLAVSAFSLWFTFRGFDLAILRDQVAGFAFVWTIPASAFFLLAFALRAARWCWILNSIRPLNYGTVAPVLFFGFFMNSILPARGGEFARAFAISKRSGMHVSEALGTIVAERTFDLIGLFGMMLMASRLLPWEKLPVVPMLALVAALIIGMIVVTLVLPRIPVGKSKLAQKVISFIAHIGAGFSVIKKPSQAIGLVLLSAGIWFLDAAMVLTLSRAASLDFTAFQAAALIVGISVGVAIPAAPGYVGTYELFGKETLVMLGFPAAISLSFVVFLHFIQMALMTAIGVPSTLWIWLKPQAAAKP